MGGWGGEENKGVGCGGVREKKKNRGGGGGGGVSV